MPFPRKFLPITRSIVLNACGLGLMLAVAVGVFMHLQNIWVVLLAAAICLFYGNSDRVKVFELGQKGLKAETREVIQEARDTIHEVRVLAKKVATYMLWIMQAEGRFGGGISPEGKDQLRAGLLGTLGELGLSEEEIAEVRKIEHPYIRFDHWLWIADLVGQKIRREQPDRAAKWTEFRNLRKNKGVGSEPSPDELEAILQELGLLEEEIADRLTDYRYWEEHKQHRRPQAWLKRYRREKPRPA